MKPYNPLITCTNFLEKWDDITTNWRDHYDSTVLTDGPVSISRDDYVMQNIFLTFDDIKDDILNQYKSLISNIQRIEFMTSILEQSDSLFTKFKLNKCKTDCWNYAVDQMRILCKILHNNFDESLFILNMKSNDIPINGRLRFKLNRSELINLFLLLKDAGIIDDNHSDYALSMFLSKFFSYYNNKEETFVPLKNPNSIANLFYDIRIYERNSESAILTIKDKIKKSKIKFEK